MKLIRTRSTPWLVVLLGLGFLALSTWSIYLSSRRASAVTDADYYSHGLRYNQTLLEQKAAAALGWETVSNLRGRLVTIQLLDNDHRPVTGAAGTLTILAPGQHKPRKVNLREIEPGCYQTELPADLLGERSAEIFFQRDGARLSKRLLLSFR